MWSSDQRVKIDTVPWLSEIAMMIQKFEPMATQTIAAAFSDGGDGWTQSGNSGLTNGDSYWMVNGQYNPTVRRCKLDPGLKASGFKGST